MIDLCNIFFIFMARVTPEKSNFRKIFSKMVLSETEKTDKSRKEVFLDLYQYARKQRHAVTGFEEKTPEKAYEKFSMYLKNARRYNYWED